MLGTGFLFRTGARRRVQEYWRTINVEQGGRFNIDDPAHDPMLDRWLDAVTAYVNLALPFPVPPRTDPARVTRGQGVFERGDLGCARCHPGPLGTDSGQGNPMLDLSGPVLLHDVGTCAVGAWPDVSHTDFEGRPRGACAFDTPVLRGLADSAPYLHDGSAATLAEAVLHPPESARAVRALAREDQEALVEYLRAR
jgi:CxxC motif-containing protein (DUF1111 family)